MRIEIFPIYYSCDGCFRRLSINCWYVGVFPLTYTMQECAEEYCELVGWKFIAVYGEEYAGPNSYSMRVEIPANDIESSATISSNYCYAAGLGSMI